MRLRGLRVATSAPTIAGTAIAATRNGYIQGGAGSVDVPLRCDAVENHPSGDQGESSERKAGRRDTESDPHGAHCLAL